MVFWRHYVLSTVIVILCRLYVEFRFINVWSDLWRLWQVIIPRNILSTKIRLTCYLWFIFLPLLIHYLLSIFRLQIILWVNFTSIFLSFDFGLSFLDQMISIVNNSITSFTIFRSQKGWMFLSISKCCNINIVWNILAHEITLCRIIWLTLNLWLTIYLRLLLFYILVFALHFLCFKF